jgi:hypothetical protein
VDSVTTTKVIARFDEAGNVVDSKGITSSAWTSGPDGWKEMFLTVNNVTDSLYFRLRGTNQGLSVPNQTDGAGNPLPDTLLGANNAEKAFADLWFYSNPVFVANHSGSSSVETNLNNVPNFRIYPNPASDNLNILVSEDAKIQMFDTKGSQVVKETFLYAGQRQSIDVNHLPDGVYFVRVYNDKFVEMQKIVINK